MVRVQFNIDEGTEVKVVFLHYMEGQYYFEVEWFDEDVRHQSNFALPHIGYLSQNMTKIGKGV